MIIHPHPSVDWPEVQFRVAVPGDAAALNDLINAHRDEGHLLPRREDEIRTRVARFVVADVGGTILACAELVPLSARVAEVRSLVVATALRRHGVATHLLNEIASRARSGGFQSLLALAHDPRYFIRHNFSIVPHEWLREKIERDCVGCELFRRCGQYAMLLPLAVDFGGGRHAPERRPAIAVA